MANEELVEQQNEAIEDHGVILSPEEQAQEIDEVDQLLKDINEGDYKPEDLEAEFYERHRDMVISIKNTEKLPLRGLWRACINIMLGPFAPANYRPRNEYERKLVYHFQKCVDARQMMQLRVEMERAELAMKKATEDEIKIKEQSDAMITTEGKEFLENLPVIETKE